MSIRDDAQAEAERRYLPTHRAVIPTELSAAMGFELGAEWAASRPVTDEEVLAALNADYSIRHPLTDPSDTLDDFGTEAQLMMRAALEAARAVRAGQ